MTGPPARDAEALWAEAMLAATLLAVDPGLGGAVIRAAPGPVRDAWLAGYRALLPESAPWRRLPPVIADDRLLGGLDIAAALGAGRRVLQRGLLAEADGGVVVAAMAERLLPATAARLAAALQDGTVPVLRDGFAERLPAGFTLIALDEGAHADERPPAVLAEHLAFHLDLDAVPPRAALPIPATAADAADARAAVARVAPSDTATLEAVCGAALALGVSSGRAPLLTLRTARAAAALMGRDAIDDDDLALAARLVLAPRATRVPEPEAPAPSTQPGEPAAANDPDNRNRDVNDAENSTPSLDELVLEAARAALPSGLNAFLVAEPARTRSARVATGGGGVKQAARRGRRIGVRPGLPRNASELDLLDTLKAAAPWQRLRARPESPASLRIRRDDFRVRRFEDRAESTVIFVVDASGSAALQRLAEAKGAVELLLAEAYVRRTRVALIAFRGVSAELLLAPTRSLARARRSLADLAGGGATPIAAALTAAGALAAAERAKGRTPLLVVLTDGRANIALDGAAFRTRAETDAITAAYRIRAAGVAAAFIDTSPRPRGEGARLAEAMAARFAPLPYVDAGAVRDVVRSLDPGQAA